MVDVRNIRLKLHLSWLRWTSNESIVRVWLICWFLSLSTSHKIYPYIIWFTHATTTMKCSPTSTKLIYISTAYMGVGRKSSSPVLTRSRRIGVETDAIEQHPHPTTLSHLQLFHAFYHGHVAELRTLLRTTASPNEVDCDGNTLLHLAVEEGNNVMVTLLLQDGKGQALLPILTLLPNFGRFP